MRRRFATLLLLIFTCAAAEGCRSAGSPLAVNPFGAQDSNTASKSDSRFMSAFRKSREAAGKSTPPAKGDVAQSPSPINDPAVKPASAEVSDLGFDAETQALIDRKLAGAPPEKAAQMRNDLRGVPPHLVPQILNAFHLGQQLEHQAAHTPPPSVPQFGPTNPPSIANQSRRPADHAAMAGIQTHERFSPPAAQPNQPYGSQPPQGFPGTPPPIMPAGHVDNSQTPYGQVQQADWQTDQTPGPMNTVTPIGEYQPLTGPHGIVQAGHQPGPPAMNSGDNLPIYQASGQPATSRVVGSLKPGEYVMDPPQSPNTMSQPPGVIQQTNVTAANGVPASVNQATMTGAPELTWRSQLGQTIALAEREIANLRPDMNEDSPQTLNYIENHVYLRSLYLMSDDPTQQARAWEPIPGIDPAQQEFWQYTLFGMSNYFDRNPQLVGQERYSEAVKSFGRAVNKLRSKASLEIGDIALCSGVTNFGNYKRFETYEFNPGQQVVLYAEIRNFATRLTEDNHYQTVLAPTIEFVIPGNGPMSGRAVHNAIEMQPTEDLCKYPRRDFFIASLFSIPRDLAQGRYVLKLTVTDKLGRKFAESTLNFVVK